MDPGGPIEDQPGTEPISQALEALRRGERDSLDTLFEVVYPSLREIAHFQLARGYSGSTLGTTALVHELYLKLAVSEGLSPRDRAHFLAVCARAMRQIVIDAARRLSAEKRGGGALHITLGADAPSTTRSADEILDLDRALTELQVLDPRLGRTVELRFFGGLSVEDTAEVLEVSPRTVKRDWRKARAVLYSLLSEEGGD